MPHQLNPQELGLEQVAPGGKESLIIGGKKHNKTYRKKRHGNKSLTAWVKFVKKVAREEKLPYRDAMMRAKVRKDKGEKWMSGGESMSGPNMGSEMGSEMVSEMNPKMDPKMDPNMEPEVSVGGRRRRSRRQSRRGSKKRRGTKKRR